MPFDLDSLICFRTEEMPFDKDRIIGLPPFKKLIAVCLSELVGTAFLVWLGCLSILVGHTLLQVAIAWGCIVSSIVTVNKKEKFIFNNHIF